jgi:hypothetical protein
LELCDCAPPACSLRHACRLRKTDDFAGTVGKTDDSGFLAACRRASWRPRRPPDGPPGAQDGLPTGLLARKTASRRASWRPRRPPDGPPGAQDGLPTGLLARKTASRRASWRPRRPSDGPPDAPDGLRRAITCRQDHLPTSPLASQVSPGAKRAFDACTFLPLTPYCRDSVLDKTAARRT